MNSLAEKFDSTITWELGIIWYDYSHHSNHHLLSEGSAGLCPNVRGLSTWKSVFTRQQSWAQSQQQRGCGALQGQVPEEPGRVAAGTAEAAWLRVRWRGSACSNAAL